MKNDNTKKAMLLRYEEGTTNPVVVASAKGHMARQLLELAKRENIAIEKDSSMLSEFLDMELSENVPPQLYQVIAEVLLMLGRIETGE